VRVERSLIGAGADLISIWNDNGKSHRLPGAAVGRRCASVVLGSGRVMPFDEPAEN